ncbi:hypothetical protein BEWA_016140 [Theileria equi strain WA]|uniref:Uncharacterized protein n=1 Tax=Theileria equi strain WA TaxID=1537102 RepID=L1LD00_THEEQ|nr:hypothetical protein BEWA_016140 [Theileria equi strain WA]EKX73053.1 hypothetical protein BEWA_016140 [Theileria equi strain WA]|eukprot:XP_004832505.1 hypothetical protein BEWA_016140 [Theileria equi strain WA]
MNTYQVDICPTVTPLKGLERKDGEKIGGKYNSYIFTAKSEEKFEISAIVYDGEPLKGIVVSNTMVEKLTIYLDGYNKILLIHTLAFEVGNLYWINQDTTKNTERVTFAEFLLKETSHLNTGELGCILSNVTQHSGFNSIDLHMKHESTAKKLVSVSDIIFDLDKRYWDSSDSGKYLSEISRGEVTVIKSVIAGSNFTKIIHNALSKTFMIRGIKLSNGKYMKINGGFPNEGFAEFNVYYRDSDYSNPLLVELVEVYPTTHNYVKTKFYLTMNGKDSNGKWDICQICSVIDEKTELVQILQNITTHNRLLVYNISDEKLRNKLGDIRKGFSVDVTQIRGSTGVIQYYSFDGMYVPFKKERKQTKGYYMVRHATIPYFTVKKIKVTKTKELTEDELPPLGTLFEKLNAYYADYSYKDAVLIELECLDHSESDESPLFFYYYSQDERDEWIGYKLETHFVLDDGEEAIPDKNTIITHIKQHNNKIIFEELWKKLKGKLTRYPPATNKNPKGEQTTDDTTKDIRGHGNSKEADEKAEERTSTGSMQDSKHNIHSGEFDAVGCGIGVTFGILAICVGIYLLFPSIKRLANHYTIKKFMYSRYV